MTKYCAPVLLALGALALSSCDSDRLEQFSTFAAAGSQYVQNFHELTAETGNSMIVTDSAVLLTARRQAAETFKDRKAEFSADVKADDALLEDSLSVLQKLDAQATLLGAYFSAVTALTNGKPNTQAASAANTFVDALNGLPVHLMSKVPFSALHCGINDRHA